MLVLLVFVLLPTALAGNEKQLAPSVHLSVRLSVRLFSFYLLNQLTFKLEFLRVLRVMTITRPGLKVVVIVQGQRSMSSEYGRDNTVTRSV